MSNPNKRPGSPSLLNHRSRKQHRDAPATREEPIVISDDEDYSEDAALKSLALAKKLQAEWDAAELPASLPVASSSYVKDEDVIMIESDAQESDETMARRLAKEWEEILSDDDISFVPAPNEPTLKQSPRKPLSKGKSKGKAPERLQTIEASLTPDHTLRQFSDLFIAERKCSKCEAMVPSPTGIVMFPNVNPPPSLVHLLHAPCRSCKTNHCRGCMSPIACPLSCRGTEKNAECIVETCCTNVRVIALFETLGGLDSQFLGERASSDERARASAARSKGKNAASIGPGGTGYGSESSGHFFDSWHGFGGARGRVRGKAPLNEGYSTTSYSDAITAHWEEIITRVLTTLTRYLPDSYSEAPQIYDMIPHESIQSLISLSQLPELLGSLLRNDSVTDWITRSDTYHAMLRLLRRMVDCELTVDLLISDGWEKASSCGLLSWMWGDGEIKWALDKNVGERQPTRTAPLYNHFKKLTRQCEAFLAGASQMMAGDDGDDEEVVKGTSLCGDIIAARDDMDRMLQMLGKLNSAEEIDSDATLDEPIDKGKGKAKETPLDIEQTYTRECERLAFQHVSMSEAVAGGIAGGGLVYKQFNYFDMVQITANQTRIPKDRLHLVKELAMTATGLPPGVWVRVDEVRNDVIKIMIAGPEGTPYSGGLFEFDCFLPIAYPNTPPLMHLRTTGGGRVRFNPNLYNQGKVCLSLLGTWPGRPEEQWIPRQSTLLQVLVSIQSMIFIDAPYFNEPGYGKANLKNPKSISYNSNIRLQTVKYAMLEWMKDEYKNHLWTDVIISHFGIRSDKICKCIQEWAKEDPNVRNYTGQIMTGMPMDGWDGLDEDDSDMLEEMENYPPSRRRRKAPAPKASKVGEDLMAQFEKGVQRIGKWPKQAIEI